MLARREPVTLRALVAGTGTSTMAVYTHFEGMPGLWRAVRQEGFTRLAAGLAAVNTTRDPVRDLVAFGAAYLSSAAAHPTLYRTMFDAGFDLEDPAAADDSFAVLVACANRTVELGRFAATTDPVSIATQFWAFGHGLASLAITGVLPWHAVEDHARTMTAALFVAAGDEQARCLRSIANGWSGMRMAGVAQ